MAEEKDIRSAKTAMKTLMEMLDEINWEYSADEENLKVSCSACGNDLPMDIYMSFNPDRQVFTIMSQLPFTAPQGRIGDAVIATEIINYVLACGGFDVDLRDGRILYRLSNGFGGSLLSKKAFEYLVMVSCSTIDEFNDKLLALFKGVMTIEDFAKSVNK